MSQGSNKDQETRGDGTRSRPPTMWASPRGCNDRVAGYCAAGWEREEKETYYRL